MDGHVHLPTDQLAIRTRSCYRRWTVRCAMSVEILSTAAKLYEQSHLKGMQLE